MPDFADWKGSVKWEDLAPGPVNKNSVKILTVDDNAASRYSIARSLREAGYRVLEASTGNEALALLAECPDLVTLDVNLPDLHGFEVCKKIKADPATAHIPILHLSCTSVDSESRVKGLAGGADAYLTEPIDRAELVATVGALLRLKAAENLARQQAGIAESARNELARLNQNLEIRVSERTIELKLAYESLRDLSARLLRMQDEERRRIARELHDSVGQTLAAIKMNNDLLARTELPAQAQQILAQNSSMVDEILSNIRTISHLLHPPLLDEAGLASALGWYVDEFSQRSGIRVNLECDPSLGRLPLELETAVFRIIQEALGNVHRHSGSATAAVRISLADEKIHLEISDEGRGISDERQQELASHRGGVGLRGMRERATQFGGEFTVHATEKGVTISSVFPFARQSASAGQ